MPDAPVPSPGPLPPPPAVAVAVPVMPQGPAHPQPPQFEVPSFRAPDVQMLVQDLATSRRDLFEERRNSQNRIAEERERSRFEIEKIRIESSSQVRTLERENDALLRGLGRLQAENDKLREENAVLRHGKSNGQAEEKAPAAPAPAPVDLAAQFNRAPAKTMVPLVGQSIPKGMAQVVPGFQVMGPGPQILPPGAPGV